LLFGFTCFCLTTTTEVLLQDVTTTEKLYSQIQVLYMSSLNLRLSRMQLDISLLPTQNSSQVASIFWWSIHAM